MMIPIGQVNVAIISREHIITVTDGEVAYDDVVVPFGIPFIDVELDSIDTVSPETIKELMDDGYIIVHDKCCFDVIETFTIMCAVCTAIADGDYRAASNMAEAFNLESVRTQLCYMSNHALMLNRKRHDSD